MSSYSFEIAIQSSTRFLWLDHPYLALTLFDAAKICRLPVTMILHLRFHCVNKSVELTSEVRRWTHSRNERSSQWTYRFIRQVFIVVAIVCPGKTNNFYWRRPSTIYQLSQSLPCSLSGSSSLLSFRICHQTHKWQLRYLVIPIVAAAATTWMPWRYIAPFDEHFGLARFSVD